MWLVCRVLKGWSGFCWIESDILKLTFQCSLCESDYFEIQNVFDLVECHVCK